MTKPTLPQWLKYGVWFIPAVVLPIPLWAWVNQQPNPEHYTVAPKPLVTPSPTFSAFPFLKNNLLKNNPNPAVPSTPQSQAQSQLQVQPRTPTPAPQPKSALPDAELARKRKLALSNLKPNVDSLVEMHVAIATATPTLSIGISGSGSLFDQGGKSLKPLSPNQAYPVQADGQSIIFAGSSIERAVWVVPSPGSKVYIGDHSYRGNVLIVGDQGKLWAVNYVNLRQYLHSVVGAEVSPSWPIHALKAQAIAARSYALTYYFKPANKLYHLGSDEYFQVYKGVESEADTTQQAVDKTAGSFVSRHGGIVESLYAASDEIVAEAFQGHGMSQLGALKLAEQNYTYEQILANYYPGTKVARVEVDQE